MFLLFWSVLTPRNQLMARTLRENGWRVSVLAWDRGGSHHPRAPESVLAEVDDWRWVPVVAGRSGLSLLTALPRLYRALATALEEVGPHDLCFHTHIFLLPLASRGSGRCLFDSAEFYVLDLPRRLGVLACLARPLARLVERWLLRGVHGVLLIDSNAGWFERYYRSMHARVQVLWNLPSRADDPDPSEVESLRDDYQGRKVVAYVGGIVESKGLELILQAASKVRARHADVLFLFIGPLREDAAQLRERVEALDLVEHARFLPFMSYRSMQVHLGWACIGLALYLLPRFREGGSGNGRKIFSYMQAGLPIVATNVGPVGAMIDEVGCGLQIDALDADTVARTICAWLDDPEQARVTGARGREAFERSYNWETESNDFLSFVESTIAAVGRAQ